MKKVSLFVCLLMVLLLGACSSAEAEDLVHYMEQYNENVNPKINKINQWLKQSQQLTPKKAYQIEKNRVLPIVTEVQQYVHSMNPETVAVKNIQKIRVKQIDVWAKAFKLRVKALKQLKNASSPEQQKQAKATIQRAKEYLAKSQDLVKTYRAKLRETADQYNVKLKETKGK